LYLMLAAVVVPAATNVPAQSCPANTTNRQSVSPKIIVQGGIQPNTNPGGMVAIGPKQDDPAASPAGAKASGNSMVAIGPKQDDPAASPASAKASGQSMLTIGPKQDDPAQPGRGSAASAKTDCGLTPVPVPH
jgi:hypothetical protein